MTKLRMTIARQAVWLSGLTELRLEQEEGQTLAEYALILALIAVVVVVVVATARQHDQQPVQHRFVRHLDQAPQRPERHRAGANNVKLHKEKTT